MFCCYNKTGVYVILEDESLRHNREVLIDLEAPNSFQKERQISKSENIVNVFLMSE